MYGSLGGLDVWMYGSSGCLGRLGCSGSLDIWVVRMYGCLGRLAFSFVAVSRLK